MEVNLTASNILFIFGVLGTIFTVYNYFRNPQIKSEKQDALMEQEMSYSARANEERFSTMNKKFDAMLLQSNNHIHTVDTKVDKLQTTVAQMGESIVRLSTIIEERIPKK